MTDPMYRQIAEDLRRKIESGELAGGSQLPTELELREQYDASRNTVRDAIKLLTNRGMVETRPGQGTFVVAKLDPLIITLDWETGFSGGEGSAYYKSEVKADRRKAEVSVPRIEIQPSSAAPELGLETSAQVVSRHQQRFVDGTPWSLQTTFYSMSLVQQGGVRLFQAEDIPTGTVQYLEETLGIKQVGWRDKIMVRTPDATEAAFFQVPDDGRVAVMEIRRTAFDASRKPLRLTVTTYPADRNQFVVNVGEVPDEEVLGAPGSTASNASSESAAQGEEE